MQTARRDRTSWAVAASVVAHAVVLTVLALQRPMLVLPAEEAGPPAPIIPILLMPRTPPPVGQKARPQPIRLHRRPQRFLPPDVPTIPIAPPAPPAAAPAPRAPVALHPAPQPEGPKGDARTALRQGPVGCANPLAVGLNRAERELCDEKFGKGAKDAPFYEPGLAMSAQKKAILDKAAAEREADYKYKRTSPTPEHPGGYLGDIGSTAHDIAKGLGSDQPEYKVPLPN
jgi:hypothetical protein